MDAQWDVQGCVNEWEEGREHASVTPTRGRVRKDVRRGGAARSRGRDEWRGRAKVKPSRGRVRRDAPADARGYACDCEERCIAERSGGISAWGAPLPLPPAEG